MRTPTNNPVGTAAQSVVKAQFELLGWGVAPNPEHDLGTDHWVMARDDERVDIRRLVGVQVKAGTTPFKRKVTVDGVVTGWWYYERDDRHFEYWSSHSIPHILALHEIKDGSTYWVHVTADKVQSTGKGRKIFVPSTQTIDADNRGALMDVALSSSTLPEFQGSAWEEGEDVPPESALRYALLTPRLLAPHGNRTPTAISPAQAIALLVQMRITTLERWQKIEPLLDHHKAGESTAWGWRFYSALWGALLEGNLDPIGVIYMEAPDAPSRAAAIAALVAIRFEEEAVPRALGEINALDQTGFSAVDRAWIEAHRARLLVETGDTGGAQASAITVAPIGRIALGDPTAAMLSGSAAELIFNLSNWDGESLASAIKGRDNVGFWWRSQTLVSGLAAQVEESFKVWSKDQSVTWGAADRAWLSMRSAMVISGHAADTPSWRNAASLLARRLLMTTHDEAQLVSALDLVRISGSDKVAKATAKKLVDEGPIDPLAQVANAVNLTAATRTSLAASVRLIAESADVLSAEDANRHARWALRILRDPGDFEVRLRPHFIVADELIGLVRRLCVSVSHEVDHEIRDHIASLPPLADDLAANRYARLVGRLIDEDWTAAQVATLKSVGSSQHKEIAAAFDRVIAAHDPDHRAGLLERIATGDVKALHSFGKVTDLPEDVAAAMISVLEGQVRDRVDDAQSGSIKMWSRDPLQTLVLLNAWHPDVARWDACCAALSEPLVIGEYTVPAIELLGRLSGEIPRTVAERLRGPLEVQASRAPRDHEFRVFSPPADPRGPARLTMALLFPDDVSDEDLLALLRGEPAQRAAAAAIAAHGGRPHHLTLLAALSKDEDTSVRAAVAKGLAIWAGRTDAPPAVSEVLDQVLSEPGTRLGLAVSETLTDDESHTNLEPLLRRLSVHPSAVVRWRANHALSRLSR